MHHLWKLSVSRARRSTPFPTFPYRRRRRRWGRGGGERESDIGNTDDASFQMVSPVTNSWRVGPQRGGVLERSQCNPWNEHFLSDGKRAGMHRPRSTLCPPLCFSSPVSHLSQCVHCLLRNATPRIVPRVDDSSRILRRMIPPHALPTIIHRDAWRCYDQSVTSVRMFVARLLDPLLFICRFFHLLKRIRGIVPLKLLRVR